MANRPCSNALFFRFFFLFSLRIFFPYCTGLPDVIESEQIFPRRINSGHRSCQRSRRKVMWITCETFNGAWSTDVGGLLTYTHTETTNTVQPWADDSQIIVKEFGWNRNLLRQLNIISFSYGRVSVNGAERRVNEMENIRRRERLKSEERDRQNWRR